MTFIHPLLLGGLLLLGLPVVIHLIMRQQPKHVLFPALRFLKLQQRTNQRKLRLRHLLLLALRMLLIALMCFALARPRLFSDRLRNFLGSDEAVAVVLVLDTSPTMGYTVAGQTCLDAAKARALELLDELSPTSRVAVIDTADPIPEWAASLAAARERLAALTIRPANHPVTDGLSAALQLFEPTTATPLEEQPLPRFVYAFSDRTPAAWDAARAGELKTRRERLTPWPKCVFVDVGVEQPADLSVYDVDMRPQVVPAHRPVVLRVTVQATGDKADATLMCRFDSASQPQLKPINLKAGDRHVVEFEQSGLAPGWHTAEISLQPTDSLPFDNARYVTFEVRQPRKVLVVCDDPKDAFVWALAVNKVALYQADVKVMGEPAVLNLTPAGLAEYQAVCLVSVGRVGELWKKLRPYVDKGGAVLIAPPIGGLNRDDYNQSSLGLLPGEFTTPDAVDASPNGVGFTDPQNQHPLMAAIRTQATQQENTDFVKIPPRTFRYWPVRPADKSAVLLKYDDAEKSPAILEARLRKYGRQG